MLRVEGAQRKHEIEVPVPSLQLIDMDCTKPCWKYDAFTVPLTMTNFISLFHFPPYSWPDPHLASSFYSQLHRFMMALIATLAVASHIASIPISISFGQDPVFPFFLTFTAGG